MKTICNICKKSMRAAALTAICILCFSFTAFAGTETSDKGPGVPQVEEPTEPAELKEGDSLGIFKTTGYCSCEKCSKGSGLTYSGTTPTPNHTISADLTLLPLGTKVKINDIVYTVEDMGGGVDGRKIDIYYGSHEGCIGPRLIQHGSIFRLQAGGKESGGPCRRDQTFQTAQRPRGCIFINNTGMNGRYTDKTYIRCRKRDT
ncbi:MAG: 3D domain-containing protein [Hungatella hathewayi]